MRRTWIAVVLGSALALLAGCQPSTRITTVWQNPEAAPRPFTSVLAVVANASPAERRAGEDRFSASITSAHAVPSYTVIPDEDLNDREKVIAAVERGGFDGVAVIRLVSSDRKTTYLPPVYGASSDPFLYGPSYGYSPTGYIRGGYTTVDTVVHVECSVYRAPEKQLIWAGSGEVLNPAGIRDLVSRVCRGAAEELRRKGLIQ